VSGRELLRMTEEEIAAVLDEGRRVQVATSNPDGTIHLVPLSYFVRDGRLALWTDGLSRKVSNLRRNPGTTCLVELGSEFADFRAVQITGRAQIITDVEASRTAGEALFARHSGGPLAEDVRAYVATLARDRVVVVVEPDRVISWDHRKLAGARPDAIGR